MKKLINNFLKISFFSFLFYLFVLPVKAIDFKVTLTNYNTDTKVANISWAPTGGIDSANIDHYKVFGGDCTENCKTLKDTTSYEVLNVTNGTPITVHAYDKDNHELVTETGQVIANKANVTPTVTFAPIGDKFKTIWGANIPGSTPEETLTNLFINIIFYFLSFAGILAVFAVVYSGYMYISSFGNEEKTEKAKKNLVWAIIGTLIIALLLTIVQIASRIITTKP